MWDARKKTRQEGFTLIELLVVIAIISLLSSLVIAALASVRVKARAVRIADDVRTYVPIIQLWMQDNACSLDTAGNCLSLTSGNQYTGSIEQYTTLNTKGFRDYFSGRALPTNSQSNEVQYQIWVSGNDVAGNCSLGGVELLVTNATQGAYEVIKRYFDGTTSNFYSAGVHDCGRVKAPWMTATSTNNNDLWIQISPSQYMNR